MGTCGLSRLVQVHGYAVRIICELPDDGHVWHWDSTFATEWEEPGPKAPFKSLKVRTSQAYNEQPLIA